MLSKSQIKYITSLHTKKFRKQHGAFIVEGTKSVQEFIDSNYDVLALYCMTGSDAKMKKIPENIECFEIAAEEMKKISLLTSPPDHLAVVRLPALSLDAQLDPDLFKGRFTIVLDDVQDPGNLGTIIRAADWFGFTDIICSKGSVDAYNPKVVQATMGSLSRMRIHYTELSRLFRAVPLPVFGAVLDGSSLYDTDFGQEGFIVLGNEGQGISSKNQVFLDHRVTIPSFGGAESLNVAISAALFCSEVRRRQ